MAPEERDPPEDPADLPARSWKQIVKRTVKEFQDDNLTDWSAALTYYGVMSLFPMLLVLVALLGLVGQESTISTATDSLRSARPHARAGTNQEAGAPERTTPQTR